eukprot:6483850-Alexandrium_andersonii.AAC.1
MVSDCAETPIGVGSSTVPKCVHHAHPHVACATTLSLNWHEHCVLVHPCTLCSMHRDTCIACRSHQAHAWTCLLYTSPSPRD